MNSTKNWYTSTTLWGVGVSALAAILNIFHIQIGPEAQQALVDGALQVIQVGSLLVAAYGRIKADTILK